ALAIQSNYKMLFILLFILWSLRCWYLNHQKLFLFALLFSVLTGMSVLIHQSRNVSFLKQNQESFYIESDSTTLKVDGDHLQFYGKVIQANSKESIVVFYTIQSEEEQQKWMQEEVSKRYMITGSLTIPES